MENIHRAGVHGQGKPQLILMSVDAATGSPSRWAGMNGACSMALTQAWSSGSKPDDLVTATWLSLPSILRGPQDIAMTEALGLRAVMAES